MLIGLGIMDFSQARLYLGQRLSALRLPLAVALIVLACVAWHVVRMSAQEFELGQRAVAHNDSRDAIAHFRRTIRWYAPFNPYVPRAIRALNQIAHRAEKNGNDALALSGFRGIRAALNSVRSFYAPYSNERATADGHIARLMAKHPAAPLQAKMSYDERYKLYRGLFGTPTRPHVGWALLAILGFVTWSSATYRFLGMAVERGVLQSLRGRLGWLWLAGMICFCLGLRLA
jgi:hypothetical protein